MTKAATRFAVPMPKDYHALFEDHALPVLTAADRYRLDLADTALSKVMDALIQISDDVITAAKIPKPDPDESERIKARLLKLVPAESAKSVVDILNAAWLTSETQELWNNIQTVSGRKDSVLQ